jgi:hypothetical protein
MKGLQKDARITEHTRVSGKWRFTRGAAGTETGRTTGPEGHQRGGAIEFQVSYGPGSVSGSGCAMRTLVPDLGSCVLSYLSFESSFVIRDLGVE